LIRVVKQNVKAVKKFFGSGGKMERRPENGEDRRQKEEGTRCRVQGTRSRKERQTASNGQPATGSIWPTADHGKPIIDY
jgi:hypothetical protein